MRELKTGGLIQQVTSIGGQLAPPTFSICTSLNEFTAGEVFGSDPRTQIALANGPLKVCLRYDLFVLRYANLDCFDRIYGSSF